MGNWEDFSIDEETFTEEDLQKAESSGSLPALRFIGTCMSVDASQANRENVSFVEIILKWGVDDVLNVGVLDQGKSFWHKASEQEKDQYEGRFQFDRISLHHAAEPEQAKNRRLLVAKRLGIGSEMVSPTTGKPYYSVKFKDWKKTLGIQSQVETDYSKPAKNGKIYVNVKFDGYEPIGKASTSTATTAGALPDDI